MRAPPEVPYLFPLESAMDELAVALRMDPIELRRVNDTRPSRSRGCLTPAARLMQCFDAGAKAFDWQRRDPQPGSMRDGDWLIGLRLRLLDVSDANGAGHGSRDPDALGHREGPDGGP